MERNTILIIDDSESLVLKEQLQKISDVQIIGITNNADLGFTIAERQQPAIIMLNIDLPGDKGFNMAEIFALEFPASGLILVTSADNKRVLRHALQVGAKEVINLPVTDEQLLSVLRKVMVQQGKRREVFSVEKKTHPQFKTVAVCSTKGGVGKSTIALNLAVAIRKLSQKRTVLVDLDLGSGNLAMMAGIGFKRTIKDITDEINNLDEEILDKYCIPHSSGLRIIPAPHDPEYAGFIDTDHVSKILARLGEAFNYVIVDTPTYLTDTVVPALEMSQEIILVTTLDLASIQNVKQCLNLLTGLSMRGKVKIVVNKMGLSNNLKLKDVEETLGMEVTSVIPNCETQAVDAVNLGVPLVLSSANSPASRLIEDLARKTVVKEVEIPRKGFLDRLVRR